jgi:CelD/BcsL family acetyltransferase involved in cellulose biosynthesis
MVLDRARDAQDAATSELARALGFADVTGAIASQPIIIRQIDSASYVDMHNAFADLASRAEAANPFMSPAMVAAVSSRLPASSLVILAAFNPSAPEQLMAVWCLRRTRDLWSLGLEVLQATLVPLYECLAAPVLDRTHGKAAFIAMLAHIKSSPDLPKTIRTTSWPLVLNRFLPTNFGISVAERWQRAILRPEAQSGSEAYLRASLGKTLNKRNNRQKQLAELGELAVVTKRGTEAVSAFEHYIALEASGWKGKSGTSLAEVSADGAYMRAAVQAFAAADQLVVDMLLLDGRPIAVGVVIEAADSNLYWKAAFDEDFARYAPGSLLHLAVTRRLFSEGRALLDSGMMEFTSPDFMPWSERSEMARATFGYGLATRVVSAADQLRYRARQLARALKGV